MEVQENILAMSTAMLNRSLALGVYKDMEPKIIRFVSLYEHDHTQAIIEQGEIWKQLHEMAKGEEIIKGIPLDRMGPKHVLLLKRSDNTYHASPWSTVLMAWKACPRNHNPYEVFNMGNDQYVLANPTIRTLARETLTRRHGVKDALTTIFTAKRFETNKWVELHEEMSLEILKFCVGQSSRTRTRRHEEFLFNFKFSMTAPSVDVRSIIATDTNRKMLNLWILDADSTAFGMIFPEVLIHDVIGGDECTICFGESCICISGGHKPSLLGCGKFIHYCCLEKAVENASVLRPDQPPKCPWCFKIVDMKQVQQAA